MLIMMLMTMIKIKTRGALEGVSEVLVLTAFASEVVVKVFMGSIELPLKLISLSWLSLHSACLWNLPGVWLLPSRIWALKFKK